MVGGQKMETNVVGAAAADDVGVVDESEVPRQKCLDLIASLRERAKELLQVEDQGEIAKRTSRMMLDMLALKRLNQEVFDAIAVRADELEGLKVCGQFFRFCLWFVVCLSVRVVGWVGMGSLVSGWFVCFACSCPCCVDDGTREPLYALACRSRRRN